MKNTQPIEFPCVIKMDNVDELEYVGSATAFNALQQEQAFTTNDSLIDSTLQGFNFSADGWQYKAQANIAVLQTWLQQHAVAVGFCCSAKLVSTDVKQLIALAGELANS